MRDNVVMWSGAVFVATIFTLHLGEKLGGVLCIFYWNRRDAGCIQAENWSTGTVRRPECVNVARTFIICVIQMKCRARSNFLYVIPVLFTALGKSHLHPLRWYWGWVAGLQIPSLAYPLSGTVNHFRSRRRQRKWLSDWRQCLYRLSIYIWNK